MISYNVPNDVQRMTVGVQGENNVREFLFDVTEWRQLTGNIGTAEMVIQRNGDSSPYATVITMHDENTVSWVPTDTDTARAGAGKIQLMWIAEGQTVKTKIFLMKVDPSLEYAVPDDSLDPWASWMPDIINAAAAIQDFPGSVEDIVPEAVSDWLEEHLEPTEPPVDDTLSVEGAAADAKKTGDEIGDVKNALKVIDEKTNEIHALVNYDYDHPADLAGDPTSQNSSRLGVTRNHIYVTLNGDLAGVSLPIFVRLNGTVARTITTSTVRGWQDGVKLTEGHVYRFTVTNLDTSNEAFMPSVSVYPIGQSSSIARLVRLNKDKCLCVFLAEDTTYNFVFFVSGAAYDNARYSVILEDLTKKDGIDEEDTDYLNGKINEYCQCVPYNDYNNIPWGLAIGSTTPTSAAVLGVYSDKTRFIFNEVTGCQYVIRLRISTTFVRMAGVSYTSYLNDLKLKPGVKYECKLEHFSGTLTVDGEPKEPSLVVYKGTNSNNYAERYEDIDSLTGNYIQRARFITTEENVSIMLRVPANSIITNYYCDIQLREIDSDEIADYFRDEMIDTVEKARASTEEPSLVFPWVTDIHRHSANGSKDIFDRMIENIKYFSGKVPCDFVLNTGDLTDGDFAKTTAFRYAYECLEGFKKIGVPYLFAQGNHDNNPYGSASAMFDIQDCFRAYFTGTRANINFDENGTDYYVDFEGVNTRVIVLNANNRNVAKKYAYGGSTAAWLASVLDVNKNTIIALHQTPYQNHTYDDATSTSLSAGIKTAINNYISAGGNVIVLSGHSHLDIAFIDPWIEIMQDCTRLTYIAEDSIDPEVSPSAHYIDVVRKNARAQLTASEDLWSVCVYKPISNDLDFIRFGAGKDRYFHLAPVAPATLTTKLTGTITWSSSDTSIATVTDGEVTGVAAGRCAVIAKDDDGNYECWIVEVT